MIVDAAAGGSSSPEQLSRLGAIFGSAVLLIAFALY
jgi:hypothetical protein